MLGRMMATNLRKELQSHLPYSIFCTAAGLMLTSILLFVAQAFTDQQLTTGLRNLFHSFHPAHLLLSATATTAMFYHYERNLLKAGLAGFIGATVFCSLSDILLPALGGRVLGSRLTVHFCLIEHPRLLLPFVLIGCLAGCGAAATIEKSTIYSHSGHVLVSTMASILYLVSFCPQCNWLGSERIGIVFIVITIAVMVPCCLSDIVFPVLIAGAGREKLERHHHDEHQVNGGTEGDSSCH